MASYPQILGEQERPASLHAEMTILGAMLVEPEAYYQASGILSTMDFALDSHRRIYGAMLCVGEEGQPVDIVTISAELRKKRELDSIGGLPYLASLSEGLPRKLSIESYVKIVRDKSLMRQLMAAAERMFNDASDVAMTPEAVFSKWQMEMLDLVADSGHSQSEDIGQIIPRVITKIAEQRDLSHELDALDYTTAIQELDLFTRGLFKNEYTLILGETGGAKTAWATQITVENAMRGARCHWMSMEMTKEQLTRRMLVYASERAKAKDVRDPRYLNLVDWTDLQDTGQRMMPFPIGIDDTRQMPLDMLIARAKVAIHRDNAKLIFVDYIQLVKSASGVRHQSDTERIEATTLALRDLAADSKDLGVHVIGLSQYSRPQDGRAGGAHNGRAKGSSSLEQSCQNMFHIIREKTETGEYAEEGEIMIGKCREGRLGRIPFRFDGDHLKFMSAAR